MSSIESIFKNDRELSVLHEVMMRDEMSAEAVVRHFFRMGQLLDHHLRLGHELGFLDDQGDFNPVFERLPKMAPEPKQLSCGCDVGVCICDYEKD
jgi:hypothetical protein